MNVTAREKVWLTKDRELVKHGDKSAALLVAREGQRVPLETVAGLKNAEQFFDGIPSAEKPAEKKELEAPKAKAK